MTSAAFLLVLACSRAAPPAPPKDDLPTDDVERASVLNFGTGSTVVSRTGEALLETSALAAIDGDPMSAWQTPPNDIQQSLVVALPARTRVDRIGIRTRAKDPLTPKEITFEASLDGRTFHPLGTVTGKAVDGAEWSGVTPTEASYLRVSIPGPGLHGGNAVRLLSALANGKELEPPHPGSIDGCWTINGRPAAFRVNGVRVSGSMRYARDTMLLDGGSNGRIVRAEWIRGPQFGYAAFAVAPAGDHLSGIQWHEEPIPLFQGENWFGDRAACTERAGDPDLVAREFLRHTGRHSLYSLAFLPNGTLDPAASASGLASLLRLLREMPQARLVAHEFREKTAAGNQTRAKQALDSLRQSLQNAGVELNRVTFVAAGSENARQIPRSEAARELYSTIDLEVRR